MALTLACIVPLSRLMRFAIGSDLFSYIPLVPIISIVLLTQRRHADVARDRSVAGALLTGALGLAAFTTAAALTARATTDSLTWWALGYVCLVFAGGFLFQGARWMVAHAFPVAFLLFMVPLPQSAVTWFENALVLASADASAWLFGLTGTPLLRDGNTFALPGIVLRVAQECSGIHSSWVLLMTSAVAAHTFLTGTWRRLVLVAFVIPLGIVRNGFRILTIGLLCVHVGPHMIDSPIHHQGGPLFFALSLVPLSLLLWWLRRQER